MTEDKTPCPNCGNPNRWPNGILACRCPKAARTEPATPDDLDELQWLAENTNMELSWGELDGDLSECAWRVFKRFGGINDRDWDLIATGDTPRDALQSAKASQDKAG